MIANKAGGKDPFANTTARIVGGILGVVLIVALIVAAWAVLRSLTAPESTPISSPSEAAVESSQAGSVFRSEGAAIEFYSTLESLSHEWTGPLTFSDQYLVDDYFAAMKEAVRESGVCSYSVNALGSNPRPEYVRILKAC